MWHPYTGVLIWKTQNPWSGLRGQLYDYTLQQTGGYFGTKLACQPLHVQLNPLTMQVSPYLSMSIYPCLSIYLSIHPSIYLSIYLSVYLSIYLLL